MEWTLICIFPREIKHRLSIPEKFLQVLWLKYYYCLWLHLQHLEHNRALIPSFTAHYLVENFSLWPEFINIRCMFDQRWVCNDGNNILPVLTHWVTWRYNYPNFKDKRSKTERVSHFPKVVCWQDRHFEAWLAGFRVCAPHCCCSILIGQQVSLQIAYYSVL